MVGGQTRSKGLDPGNAAGRDRDMCRWPAGETLLPRWGQREEGEEEKIMTYVHGQDLSDCGKTGGRTLQSIFCMHPEDTEKIR